MTRLTDGERLVKVETKLDTVIEQQKNINDKLDLLLPTFATVEDLKAIDTRHAEAIASLEHRHQTEIAEIKKSRNLWAWLSPTLTALVTAVVTYLAIEYLKNN